MSLELTDVKVFVSANKVNIGYGTATFNEGVQVRFSIRRSNAGSLFVSWPQSSYEKDGKRVYTNEVNFVTEESDDNSVKYAIKNEIENEIIKRYNQELSISPKSDGGPKLEDPIPSDAPIGSGGTVPTKPKRNKPSVKWS